MTTTGLMLFVVAPIALAFILLVAMFIRAARRKRPGWDYAFDDRIKAKLNRLMLEQYDGFTCTGREHGVHKYVRQEENGDRLEAEFNSRLHKNMRGKLQIIITRSAPGRGQLHHERLVVKPFDLLGRFRYGYIIGGINRATRKKYTKARSNTGRR